MGVEFRASSSHQMEAVAELLRESFHASPDAPLLDRSYLSWKYHDQGPAWSGSRSYILSDGARILAHAAIWPVELRLEGEVRHGLGFGDWVASETYRGAGLLLLKNLVKLGSFVLVTGGAQITRQILPRMGFEPWADRTRYVRVLRPLRQGRMRPDRIAWKEPLRVIRNTAWSLRASARTSGWTAQEGEPSERLLSFSQAQPGSVYGADFVRYMLRCPTGRFHFLELHQNGEARGYCVLGFIDGQARIADLRIASEAKSDWSAAVAVVLSFVRTDETTCEIVAMGSVRRLNDALIANGFSARGSFPLVVFDSEGRMDKLPLPQLGMLEDDSSTVSDAGHPFVT